MSIFGGPADLLGAGVFEPAFFNFAAASCSAIVNLGAPSVGSPRGGGGGGGGAPEPCMGGGGGGGGPEPCIGGGGGAGGPEPCIGGGAGGGCPNPCVGGDDIGGGGAGASGREGPNCEK